MVTRKTDRARLAELRKKFREHDSDLSGEDDREMYEIGERIKAENAAAIPRPTCCAAGRDYPVLYVSCDYGDCDRAPITAGWSIARSDSIARTLGTSAYGIVPTFCPFCGVRLPELVRKDKPPSPLCIITDGGYYCDTCHERGDACMCFPPETAFELAAQNKKKPRSR